MPREKTRAATDYPRVEIATRAELRAWFAANHSLATGVWLVTTKRTAGGRVTWNDIVEEALCVGWVDSLPRKLNATTTMLLVTPRKPQSNWSAKNKAHVAALEAQGLMRAAGTAAVALAKASGRWDALYDVTALKVPADLAAAFTQYADALKNWEAFPASTKRGILEWISLAKRDATRAARVDETARLANDNIRANQWRGPKASVAVPHGRE